MYDLYANSETYNESTPYILLLVVVGCFGLLYLLYFIMRKLNRECEAKFENMLNHAPNEALQSFNQIDSGLLFSGRSSKLIKSTYSYLSKEKKYNFSLLCKTESDRWYVYEFNYCIYINEVSSPEFTIVDANFAKQLLANDIDLYQSLFGDIKPA